ncbi:non-ribosomal peptide synthetase [Desmospora profundinema]|uniref:Amino acid adenylation domain-containing protein n=1 Tax=Desmospora profundinema TaxID=1571184 RepID=A0ABU1IH25_9BACL|nr:non-ribosomal peptide synthetase [Desmospora profundinema]MDR6224078.1 amino acid adenylation domain-containing protein [Desmospora profundinema]
MVHPYPLTAAQKRMWYTESIFPHTSVSNIVVRTKVANVDLELMEKAIQILVSQHEMLRVRLVAQDGREPAQYISDESSVELKVVDLSDRDQEQLEGWFQEEAKVPLGFYESSLYDFVAVKWKEETFLLIKCHHMIMDGISVNLLGQKMKAIYERLKRGLPIDPPAPYGLAHYIESEAAYRKSKRFLKDQQFWHEEFERIPSYLAMRVNPLYTTSIAANRRTFVIPSDLKQRMERFCQKHQTSMYTLFMSAMFIYFSRIYNEKEMVLGTYVGNRKREERDALGMFVSTVPFRMEISDDLPVLEWLRMVNRKQMRIFRHQKYPYNQLVQELQHQGRDVKQLFTVGAEYQEITEDGDVLFNGYDFYEINVHIKNWMKMDQLELHVDFRKELFQEDEIEQLVQRLVTLIQDMVQSPDKPIAHLEICTESERQKQLVEWIDTEADFPKDQTIHGRFADQAVQTPHHTAVVYKEEKLTYQELHERSNSVARVLLQQGVKPGDRVGLVMEKSHDFIVGMLAILKSGGAYVPIDPEYPVARIRYLLEDSRAEIIVSQTSVIARLNQSGEGSRKWLNIQRMDQTEFDGSHLTSEHQPTDLAYVIYTSGTTGQPKGVMVEHRSVMNLVTDSRQRLGIQPGDRIGQFASISFDASVWEVYVGLLTGASLYLIPKETIEEPARFESYVKEHELTVLSLSATYLNQLDPTNMTALPHLRHVLAIGSASSPNLAKRWKEKYVNAYGPAEAAVYTTMWQGEGAIDSLPYAPIGKPIRNANVYIVNPNQKLQPIGIPGELCIGGVGLARGYLGKPALTAEKFVPNPFAKGQRMYRTGDLARYLPDGNIEFLGRMDHQVKVRGYRIEPGEIESALLEHPKVKEATVRDWKDDQGEADLCGYVVLEESVSSSQVKTYLSQKLPPYMIPSFVLEIDQIPLTPNGKVDRDALPKPDGAKLEAEYIPPVTEMEKTLVRLWEQVLGTKNVGVTHSFFELGGNSIKAIQLVNLLRQERIHVEVRDLFRYPTISELCLHGKERKSDALLLPAVVEDKKNLHQPFPLTEIQLAYLLGRNSHFELGGVATHSYLEWETSLDMERLNQGLQQVIKRHPMLRAVVLPNGTQQILSEELTYTIEVEDLTGLSLDEQEERLQMERARMSHQVFPPDKWPLFELKAFRVDDATHWLCCSFDVLVMDGASLRIFWKEWMHVYHQPERSLPSLQLTFRDYMSAYQQIQHSPIYEKAKAYWLSKRDHFPSAPALRIQTHTDEVVEPRFKCLHQTISGDKWTKIKQWAQTHRVTPSALLCTAYGEILAHWSNQRRLAINSTVFNRYPVHPEVEQIVGDFTSLILLDLDLPSDQPFIDKVRQTQGTMMEGLEHRYYDGVRFLRDLIQVGQMETRALMPIIFTSLLLDDDGFNWTDIGSLRYITAQTPQVYLDVVVTEQNGELVMMWNYVEQLFDEDMIRTMLDQYAAMLEQLAEKKEPAPLQLTSSEQALLTQYNQTEEKLPITTLHQLFVEQAKHTPDQTAVVLGQQRITYQELDRCSNQVAHHLRERGFGVGDRIGVLADRKLETIINLLGVVKAGAAYVPLDPDHPKERRDYVLHHSRCQTVITPDWYQEQALHDAPADEGISGATPEDVAYVIYTSGSTGKPKGVVVSHGAAANTIQDINRKFGVNAQDRVIGISSICFDLSVYDIFGTLSAGATLVMVKDQRDVRRLVETVEQYEITIWNSVPVILDLALQSVDSLFDNQSLRLTLLSGDWIPLALPEKVNQHFPHADVISLGGATEASIWSIYYPIEEVSPKWKSIPYGRPLANQQYYVLNDQLKPCPIGVEGELYIGGCGLAAGYLFDEEKTRQAFIQHPTLGRLYRTGDYGVLHRSGYIEFLGRKDHQVKIQGYRVELEEISNTLLTQESITQAVVIDRTEEGRKVLCAYFAAEEKIDGSRMRDWLARLLPSYMVPAYFVQVEQLPLNPNGKIDRNALPEPAGFSQPQTDYVGPRSEAEATLVSVWERVLKVNPIGIQDDFFARGGDSIKAIQIIQLLAEEELALSLNDFFQALTIQKMAPYLEEITSAAPVNRLEKNDSVHHQHLSEEEFAYIQGMFEDE